MDIEKFTEKVGLKPIFGEIQLRIYKFLAAHAVQEPDLEMMSIRSALLGQAVLQAALNKIATQRSVLDDLLLTDAAASARQLVVDEIKLCDVTSFSAIKISDSLKNLKRIEELEIWQLQYIFQDTVEGSKQVLPNCLPELFQEITCLVDSLVEELPSRTLNGTKKPRNRELELEPGTSQSTDDSHGKEGDPIKARKHRTGRR